jgi:hypothetical protein
LINGFGPRINKHKDFKDMRCHICDSSLEAPIFNSDHNDYEPCPTCMVVILDTLAGWTDKASAAEDDLPDEGFLSQFPDAKNNSYYGEEY